MLLVTLSSPPLTVRTLQESPDGVSFVKGTLIVKDDIPNGYGRRVRVDVGQGGGNVYLRTVSYLAKAEFENLFDFHSRDTFYAGRVICMSSKFARLEEEEEEKKEDVMTTEVAMAIT